MILNNFFRYLRKKKVFKKIFKGSSVCDIGCGSGAHFLKEAASFISFGFGFDKDIDAYKNSKIELKELDLEKNRIPLNDKAVDIVTMLAVLEHLSYPQNILKEIFRILKPEGFLMLTTPAPRAKPILEFLAFKLKIIKKEDILEHKKYYLPYDIENLLLKCGFEKEKITFKYFEFGFNILVIAKK